MLSLAGPQQPGLVGPGAPPAPCVCPSLPQVDPYLPYEYTCEGMLERIHAYIQHQDFCASPPVPAPGGGPSPTEPLLPVPPSATHLEWAQNASVAPGAWPPAHSLRAWLATPRRACKTDACLDHGLIASPSFFPFLNSQDAFQNPGRECFLQKEPLLFSCAGSSTKYQRLCPCRDFRKGQEAGKSRYSHRARAQGYGPSPTRPGSSTSSRGSWQRRGQAAVGPVRGPPRQEQVLGGPLLPCQPSSGPD
ncbi:LOW QUALITY PROTEIN: alpha-1,6-mannosylglycoprotein 6-beta-N-acetylglucosaminyltransferase B-like [Canis lupus familiaris]|uniref:LOW QUALITY PROTEIN: alpha-1,6-mannosylglycoprotein 6-beta-N-acetylglucosaminyltransferase B-like n=1 Tax=Canis lupus familiaris TaxID=9615 RepID=UPI0018F3DF44|nr:LOW QUALITY PROTEIN: alpha-1,6-mannosylglycoprotein 6-beta-N-acetylglucosaminyltransferase B-like [Canis lupus familiaris]